MPKAAEQTASRTAFGAPKSTMINRVSRKPETHAMTSDSLASGPQDVPSQFRARFYEKAHPVLLEAEKLTTTVEDRSASAFDRGTPVPKGWKDNSE
ncbi:hypothetical protein DL764_006871 [Monosporascus ibericus]|uniref:Uncharacterized protein n=1 Tax=Monosporascus ibericus TaxID=155417 RepID=A0A4Q4T6Q4_9PEZI|nr:hypothetical protein DL764_006871 [Monosporascus ibericus]